MLTYKCSDIKDYIDLANILLEEAEINLVSKFADFYAVQNNGQEISDEVVVAIWQGLNDTHTIFIDMMKFYLELQDKPELNYEELEEYKKEVYSSFEGFVFNLISSNREEYFYGEHELPRVQGVYFGIHLVKDEIMPSMEILIRN